MKWLSIEIGIPLMLTGISMCAMGLIINYITMEVWDVTYPVMIFIQLLGMLLTIIGASSILNIGKAKE